jgi:hypothetical protein
MEPKPRHSPWRWQVVAWLLFAVAVIEALKKLTNGLTGLVSAAKELLRALGYVG